MAWDPIALYRNRVLESQELKLRSDLHLSRKAWHVGGIFFIIYLFAHLSRQDALFYLAIAGLIIIPFDILRLKRPDLNQWAVNIFKPVIPNAKNKHKNVSSISCKIYKQKKAVNERHFTRSIFKSALVPM